MTPLTFEIGLDSFGEVATDDGRTPSDAETVRLLLVRRFPGSRRRARRGRSRPAHDLHLSRFDLTYDIMRLPRQARSRSIELLGREVAPLVRELLTKESTHV
ncbi:hypothetical protein [Streptomyces sp. NBC_01462]|uniref:hypothetical protein n=1 Tax=Streptomyces sp. NBC_01462 TaxID=2903876 RepID=UPI002E38164A|nr:hypothetical protein [Streptomyces sp. NBC_01462]